MEILHIAERIVRGILRRRKRLLLLCVMGALGVFPTAAFYLSKEPPRFRTSTVILLEARPDRMPVFQEFSPFRPLPVQLAILRSRSLAESVIENLPKSTLQDLIDNPYHVDWQQVIRNAYLGYTGREPEIESPQRRALKEMLAARVTFEVRADGIVAITAEASRPQIAVDIATTYVETLIARTRSFNVDDARVTREFLEQQIGDVKKALASSEQSLRSFVAANGGLKIPERSQATVTQLTQAEAALAEIEAARKMLAARVNALRQKAETQKHAAAAQPPPAAPAAPPTPPVEVQRLRAQLVKLETALLDLRVKYTEEHPRVRLVKDRIAEIQDQLGDAIKENSPVVPLTAAVPPAERINFAEQLVALEASFHSVSAQEEAIRQQVEMLRQSLKGLSGTEVQYARLTRETESNRTLNAMLADKLTAARIREQGEMKVVKVIDPASNPVPAMGQGRLKMLLAASVLSLLAGVGAPAAVEWLHRRVETAEDVESATGLPVLVMIPRIRSRPPLFIADYPTNGSGPTDQLIFTEAFRTLRVSVQLFMKSSGIRTLLVTSPFAHEGKSLVVANLGLALAESGTRVVIADSDLQRPVLHRTMKLPKTRGDLVKLLHAEQHLDDALTPVGDNIWVVPGGDAASPQTRGMLASGRMTHLIGEMAEKADLVICDSSPVLLVADNLLLAGAVDGVILVARAGSTTCRDLIRAKKSLEDAGAKILGVVVNEMPAGALRRHYKRYYYSYVKKVSKTSVPADAVRP